MPQVCFYFQLHQPYRLGDFSVLDVGHAQTYFDSSAHQANQEIFQKVSHKSYLPMLRLLEKLVNEVAGFKVSFSCSGIFLEQAQAFQPEVIQLLQRLAQSDQVEFLAETYYHSLASLYSPSEFRHQVRHHQYTLNQLLGVQPRIFRNTELIYVNQIARLVNDLGFKALLTEAVPRYLEGHSLTQPFVSAGDERLPLLLKHAQLSDDVAFRFSDRQWQWYPLTVDRYLEWVEIYGEQELLNLFMDFETFGEHQWADTGIFEFFATFVKRFLTHDWNRFVTPSEVLERLPSKHQMPVYDVPLPISWADVDRDLTAWTENPLQQDTLNKLYALEPAVLQSNNLQLIEDWRKLQTSDHFYYMCTKWAADGDVHAYFSPYETPYEAYRKYSVVLADLTHRLL